MPGPTDDRLEAIRLKLSEAQDELDAIARDGTREVGTYCLFAEAQIAGAILFVGRAKDVR